MVCVSPGEDCEAALEFARRHRPIAITLDMGLPDVNGRVVLDPWNRLLPQRVRIFGPAVPPNRTPIGVTSDG